MLPLRLSRFSRLASRKLDQPSHGLQAAAAAAEGSTRKAGLYSDRFASTRRRRRREEILRIASLLRTGIAIGRAAAGPVRRGFYVRPADSEDERQSLSAHSARRIKYVQLFAAARRCTLHAPVSVIS